MFDQLFEGFRKASESSLQMQQDVFRQWTQQWAAGPPNMAGPSADWTKSMQKRWVDLTIDLLNKQRESLDAACKAGVQLIEQTFRASDAKSTDDYRRMIEGLWRTLFETFKTQSETQFREFTKWSEKSFEFAHTNQA